MRATGRLTHSLTHVLVQRLHDNTYIGSGDQFRPVDSREKDFGDLLPGLLLEFDRGDMVKIQIGLGLFEEKKPCHASLLVPGPHSVKQGRHGNEATVHQGDAMASYPSETCGVSKWSIGKLSV